MGELSITSCFELAKRLRQPPRKIADQLWSHLLPIEGVERVSVAGAGYINLHLDRARLAEALFALRTSARAERERPRGAPLPGGGKMLVEHTSINPNKAAHIGHLRNAVLGDTFVRLLRAGGRHVDVQNYIDNTGVQVADVVAGFVFQKGKSKDEILTLVASDPKLDFTCWDLYARVSQWYAESKENQARRGEVLHAIEHSAT